MYQDGLKRDHLRNHPLLVISSFKGRDVSTLSKQLLDAYTTESCKLMSQIIDFISFKKIDGVFFGDILLSNYIKAY